ncbi:MAG: hypothetical protein JWR37_5506 [Mycobacterium sp.]|jgi:hypothetical protein|nr:hypothetical protein [Mycobacterium sp.]
MSERFYLEPAAGDRAASLCDEAADEIIRHANDLVGSAPLRELLGRHADGLSGFAERFRAVDGVYGDADMGGADRLRGLA